MAGTVSGEFHEMLLASIDKDGRELWKCTVCPRSFIIERIMLDQGNTGMKHHLRWTKADLRPRPETLSDITPDELNWLTQHQIDWEGEAPNDN